jgi:hypothetical protein
MKKILTSVALCALVAMAGCAKLNTVISAVTTSNIPAKTMYVGISAFNVIETPAIAYVSYCSVKVAPVGCDDAVIQTKIVPAINSGITAKKTLLAFLQAHPGQLGDSGVYDALVTATSALTTYSSLYTVKK